MPAPPLDSGQSSGNGVTPARSSPRAIAAATTGARSSPPNVSGAISTGGWSTIHVRTTRRPQPIARSRRCATAILSAMAPKGEYTTTIEAAGREIRVTSPSKQAS